jgi:hypothetical protein
MDATETFAEFLSTQTPHIGVEDYLLNLVLAAVVTLAIGFTFVRCGGSLSNRKIFARNLVMVGMTTMVIITIVKSSLALSLGLVGALSIVRFRTPIKEPEELAYLFLGISAGLGFGAGQRLIVSLGIAAILAAIWVVHWRRANLDDHGMHLVVASANPPQDLLDRIVRCLEDCAAAVTLRRVEESADSFQGDFTISFDRYRELSDAKRALQALDANIQVSFLDNRIA